jgi:hypothetical protein
VRYFFHVTDSRHSTFADEAGTALSGSETALRRAAIIAAELAEDGDSYWGYSVIVVDETGDEVGKVPVGSRAAEGMPR